MKKSLQERLNASLDKALDPPRKRPKQELDALLDEYDDGQALRSQRAPAPETVPGILAGIPAGIPIPPPDASEDPSQGAKRPRRAVKPAEETEEPGAAVFVSLDATHTASEKIIYSHMYRETVSKGSAEGHFGPALLMKLSGIRSRNTVHKALYGLVEKLSVERVAEAQGSPFGPRYRVYGPQEILRRRKAAGMVIDTQTKRITEPGGYPRGYPRGYPKIWEGGIPNFGILLNRLNINKDDDDEAFAGFAELMRTTTAELTGRTPSAAERERWRELAEVLSAELKIAAGRTTVSSVPAFLAEHLRRRLWKKDKRQIEAEASQQKASDAPKIDASQCPDCCGTGMWYPEGFEKGVARCKHKALESRES